MIEIYPSLNHLLFSCSHSFSSRSPLPHLIFFGDPALSHASSRHRVASSSKLSPLLQPMLGLQQPPPPPNLPFLFFVFPSLPSSHTAPTATGLQRPLPLPPLLTNHRRRNLLELNAHTASASPPS
jgi:hypothetical protein